MHPHPIRHLLASLLLGSALPATAADFTSTWNSTTGNWTDTTKWSTPGAPGTFPNNGSPTPTYDAIMNGGTLFRDTAITIEKFTLAGGSLQGANALTLNSTFTFTGGAIDSSAPVNANGGVTINTGNDKFLGGGAVLNLNSDTAWSAGRLRYYGGTLNNAATRTLTMSFDGTMVNEASTNTFNNAGIFTKSAGAGTAAIGITTNNTGTVNANSGTLSFNGGGTSTGAWNVASGATLNFGGGTHHLNSGSVVTGSGTGVVSFTAGNTTINAGSSYSVAGTTVISGGIANFIANATTHALTLSGGDIQGSGTVTVTGALNFSGRAMDGTGITNANGGTTFSTGADKFLGTGRTLNLNSNSDWTGGTLRFWGGTLNNTASNTFTTNFNGTMQNDAGTNAFNNAGIFTKNGATGTTTIGIAFNNTGTVNANAGTLSINNGGTGAGIWNVASGATLNFGSGTSNLSSGSSITGSGTGVVSFSSGPHTIHSGSSYAVAGTTLISGSFVSFNSSATTNGLTVSSGRLQGTGTMTVTGALNWTGGGFDNVGITNANGGTTMSTGGDKVIGTGRTLNLNSNTSWTGGTVRFFGGTINNTASNTFTNNFDGTMQHDSGTNAFNNAGIFTKSAGAGSTTINANVTFSNTGTVNVNAGTLALNGNVTQHSGSTLTGGTWNVTGSTLAINTGSNITTLGSAATVKLSGSTATFAKINSVATNQGTFNLANNRDFTTAGAYANSGTTRVEDSTTVMTIGTSGASAYTQTGPSSVTILAGGAMIDASAFNLNGGALQGTGTIDANLTANTGNATLIAPGASPGTLTINGSTVLGGSNTLAMEIGGLAAGIDYDLLDVNGILTLGGLLDIDFINGFDTLMQIGDQFDIVTTNGVVGGAFSNVANGGFFAVTGTAHIFQLHYGALSAFNPNNVTLLAVTPEPSRALLLMLGLAGALLRRRRR